MADGKLLKLKNNWNITVVVLYLIIKSDDRFIKIKAYVNYLMN